MSQVSDAADRYAKGIGSYHGLDPETIFLVRKAWLAGFDAGAQSLWNRVAAMDDAAPKLKAEVAEALQETKSN